uniref:Uncharacterized protein n=1 Tax=Tanacetum cinerariifolium TaxID=118510 RepID=A0A6L2MAT3_TANCI|nr:hypothetical protein [Tanacetum cinerariifolium]
MLPETYSNATHFEGVTDSEIAKRKNLLSKEVLNSLSALIYRRALDTTALREFIDYEVLYERMDNIEIRRGAIERMSYRQSYHQDKYAGVFEHMVGIYSVPLQGAYNPPGYMISSSMASIVSSTHHSGSSQMMMSSVEMTRVGCDRMFWVTRENDIFSFDGTIRLGTFQLEKSTNFVGSRKIGMIRSIGLLEECKRCKIPFICEDGLTIVWDFENLTELCK